MKKLDTYFKCFVVFALSYLGVSHHNTKQELDETKRQFAQYMTSTTDLEMMLHDFTRMAPEEMERIATRAIKKQIELEKKIKEE
tara:strand:- start:100 stop:351 length:252 start_codon:yes stop_codon:yes gene_type:complete